MSQADDDTPRTEDPDRAAILARRQHFIAIALSGLTTACARPEASPEPCLSVIPASDSPNDEPAQAETTSGGTTSGDTTSGETTSGETTSGETSGGSDSGGETGAPPQPCLKVAPPPEPCLKKAPPKPCLKKAPPKPCLNVMSND